MTRSALRPATSGDVEAIAAIWCAGWPDGHLGHVPGELANHRRLLADFVRLVEPRVAATTVAADGGVIGFVTVRDDEVEQVYVARSVRGSGVAATLLNHAEETIAERFDVAWLAVVAGNARARRFYVRQGWQDAGPFTYYAEIEGGSFAVPCHRYEKQLGSHHRSA